MKLNGTTVPTGRDNTYSSNETKIDTQTGRAVYADKDKYENDLAYKADIDKYIKEGFRLIFGTPDSPSEGGSGGDKGYECTESWTTLTEESVTTVASNSFAEALLAYSTFIDADTIKVTFNSVQYECNKRETGDYTVEYGAPWADDGFDFSEYPFNLLSDSHTQENFLMTQNAGTYTVKIEAFNGESITTTPCFEKAVKSVVGEPLIIRYTGETITVSDTTTARLTDTLATDAVSAFLSGRPVLVESESEGLYGLVIYGGENSVRYQDEQIRSLIVIPPSNGYLVLMVSGDIG